MNKITKYLSLILVLLILSSCQKENDVIYNDNQIKNFLLSLDSLLEKEESHPPYMIFSNRPSEQDSSSLLYWIDSDKAKKMNPILLVVERNIPKNNILMYIVISTNDNKYCLIENKKEAVFPDSCIIFDRFKTTHPSDDDKEIYLSREGQDILLFELKKD